MMRWLVAALVASFSLGVGCSTGQPSSKGTLTNWLRACDSDSDCGSELSCSCDICTLPCDTDADCSDGVCGGELALATQCLGREGAVPICLPPPEGGCTQWALPQRDQSGEANTSDCDHPGALVCENFDGTLSEWVGVSVGERAFLQDCQVARGQGALRFNGEHTQVQVPFASPLVDGPLHLRAFVRLSSDAAFQEDYLTIFTIWAGESEGAEVDTIKLAALPGGEMRLSVSSNSADTLSFESSPGDVPRDEWVCVELAMEVDDITGSASVALDGATIQDVTAIDTRAPGPYVRIHATNFTGLTAGELFVDDLVIATEPIGCD